MQLIGLLIGLVAAVAVYSDADQLKKQGARVTPFLWAFVVFLFVLIAVPLYVILRYTMWRKQINAAKGLAPQPLSSGEAVLVVVLSGVLLLGILGTLAALAWLWGLWEV